MRAIVKLRQTFRSQQPQRHGCTRLLSYLKSATDDDVRVLRNLLGDENVITKTEGNDLLQTYNNDWTVSTL